MTSKTVALLLADLGVTKSHSRPHVSNDNPFSESQFKTLKYRPDFPDRFGSLEHGRSFCGDFFPWYNTEHHHVGLGLFTPHDVHYGLAEAKRDKRVRVLAEAFAARPGILSGSFSGFGRKESVELAAGRRAAGARATLPPARSESAYPRECGGRKVFGRKRRVGRSLTNDSIGQTRN